MIDYYYDRSPESEEEAERNRDGIRKYLRLASKCIDELLHGRLR